MISLKLNSAQPSGATTKNTKVVVKNATVRTTFKEREGSVFTAMTANQTLDAAKKLPDPRKLWKEFWFENEVCCLFADTNVGKSILAVQIAKEIAKTDRVLYYDFELSMKQFQTRYTDPKSQKMFKFPSGLIRLSLSTEKLMAMGDSMEDSIMAAIEGDVIVYGAKFVIVDNVSWLANSTNSSKVASNLVKRLVTLRNKYGLSILVLAHNRKRAQSKPISENDLSGSKCLINFSDSAFAIGRSAAEADLKYIKQIKVRTGKHIYDEHHVMLCTIEQRDSFLQFVEQGFGEESEHLKRLKADDIARKKEIVKQLQAKGMSVRKIAEVSGIPPSTVGRYLPNEKGKSK